MNRYLITFRPLSMNYTFTTIVRAKTDRTALKRVMKEYPFSDGPGLRKVYRLTYVYENGLDEKTGMMK